MPERDKYSKIDTGIMSDFKGGEYIILYGEHKPNFLILTKVILFRQYIIITVF